MNEISAEQVKICRHCHSIYKDISQKYCGNGCEHLEPYSINGKKNNQIEEREVILKLNFGEEIRWICIECGKEYGQSELENLSWKCKCGKINNFYPFTSKYCRNTDCMESNFYHKLSLEAKVCDLCGKSTFLFNKNKNPDDFIIQNIEKDKKSSQIIKPLKEFVFKPQNTQEVENKNLLSITVTILNNNYEIQSFGENLEVNLENMIRKAPSFIPDSIYSQYIFEYGLDKPLFTFIYDSNQHNFHFSSLLDVKLRRLNARYIPEGACIEIKKNDLFPLNENELILISEKFFKLRVWVY